MQMKKTLYAATALALVHSASAAVAEELTIATVNNSDMIIMQELSCCRRSGKKRAATH